MEKQLEEIIEDVKNILSKERYEHSVNVMYRAEELAKKYNVDVNKAKLIGISHDIAKNFSNEEYLEYAKLNNIEIDDIEKEVPELLHAKVGADICKKKYGFTEDMQKAITYHTTGNENMDDLAKVLFIADKTSKERDYIDFKKVREAEKLGLTGLLIFVFDMSITYTIQWGGLIHPTGIYTRNKFLKEITNK